MDSKPTPPPPPPSHFPPPTPPTLPSNHQKREKPFLLFTPLLFTRIYGWMRAKVVVVVRKAAAAVATGGGCCCCRVANCCCLILRSRRERVSGNFIMGLPQGELHLFAGGSIDVVLRLSSSIFAVRIVCCYNSLAVTTHTCKGLFFYLLPISCLLEGGAPNLYSIRSAYECMSIESKGASNFSVRPASICTASFLSIECKGSGSQVSHTLSPAHVCPTL